MDKPSKTLKQAMLHLYAIGCKWIAVDAQGILRGFVAKPDPIPSLKPYNGNVLPDGLNHEALRYIHPGSSCYLPEWLTTNIGQYRMEV
jgi:hypothetical protein